MNISLNMSCIAQGSVVVLRLVPISSNVQLEVGVQHERMHADWTKAAAWETRFIASFLLFSASNLNSLSSLIPSYNMISKWFHNPHVIYFHSYVTTFLHLHGPPFLHCWPRVLSFAVGFLMYILRPICVFLSLYISKLNGTYWNIFLPINIIFLSLWITGPSFRMYQRDLKII